MSDDNIKINRIWQKYVYQLLVYNELEFSNFKNT